MKAQILFLFALAVGSASLGATVAVKAPLSTASHLPQPELPPTEIAATQLTSASQAVVPQMAPPQTAATQPLTQPTLFPPPENTSSQTTSNSQIEYEQIRTQLRRAIHNRNAALLRSLLRASSVREALRNVAETEQVNFDNLDASTWTVLEKAIDYRCQQRTGICLNRHGEEQPVR